MARDVLCIDMKNEKKKHESDRKEGNMKYIIKYNEICDVLCKKRNVKAIEKKDIAIFSIHQNIISEEGNKIHKYHHLNISAASNTEKW
jgi:negative regulator of genetic competence, sporulation and motility